VASFQFLIEGGGKHFPAQMSNLKNGWMEHNWTLAHWATFKNKEEQMPILPPSTQ